ncbi:MAG TPA: nicotinate-nucleotide adenylyltransferase [Syntrophomonadaceae bacterium]|nr:nicotinate-nucleotide adenylyltransferase [Syntrophomonadaceae bacterium]
MANTGSSLGLIGGTFNPIHNGHLLAAEYVRCEFGLGKVLFVPSARPPHKEGVAIIPGEERCSMVKLAINDNPYFQVSTLELERPGPSYTVDTLAYYQEHYPGTTIYFIMGTDSLLLMETWKDLERLACSGRFIVVTRPGYKVDLMQPSLVHLPAALWENLRFLEIPGFDISSSDIRRRVAEGKSIKYLLPAQVEEYIYTRQLYSTKGDGPC